MDRNNFGLGIAGHSKGSLSARRAWIEIPDEGRHNTDLRVALRKESVDRNPTLSTIPPTHASSLSARRAWIEISRAPPTVDPLAVALRKESVDRNRLGQSPFPVSRRRSPQGERG